MNILVHPSWWFMAWEFLKIQKIYIYMYEPLKTNFLYLNRIPDRFTPHLTKPGTILILNSKNMLSMTKTTVLFNSVQSFRWCCCACWANDKTLQHMKHKLINQSHFRYLLFQVRGEEGNEAYGRTEKKAGENWEEANRDMPPSWSQLLPKYAVPGRECRILLLWLRC